MQQSPEEHLYRLDPDVGRGRWVMAQVAGFMSIIVLPMAGFILRPFGADSETTILAVAALCVACLIWMMVEGARYKRSVPEAIRFQSVRGKLFPAIPALANAPASLVFYGAAAGEAAVTLLDKGVLVSPAARVGMSWHMLKENFSALVISQYEGMEADFPISWHELEEWQVRNNSDGPDYYRLCFANRQSVSIRRPCDPAMEPRVLDYVRSVGQCPVRLFDNV